MQDAPDRIWTVRACLPNELDGHARADGKFQAVFYRATPRREGGFHVWTLDGEVQPQTWSGGPITWNTADEAEAFGKQLSVTRGVEFIADVKAFDLAPRLADLVPNAAHRAMVRLGNGWQFAVLVRTGGTSRGVRHVLALAEHDRAKNSQHAWNFSGINVKLVQHLGRLSDRQFAAAKKLCKHWGIPILNMDFIPRAAGKRIQPKHLPDKP